MGETSSKIKVTAPSGAPTIVAFIAGLIVIREGIGLFWTLNGLFIFYGIIEIILAGILFIVLNIVDFGVEFFKKLHTWWFMLILGALVIMFEIFASNFSLISAIASGFLLGGVLIIIAAIVELMSEKEKMKPSQIVALFGVVYTVIEIIILFLSPTIQNVYHGIIGIIFIVILLLSMQKKVNLKVPYEWWVVLIIGFVLFSWILSGAGGTIILISFILMLLAY